MAHSTSPPAPRVVHKLYMLPVVWSEGPQRPTHVSSIVITRALDKGAWQREEFVPVVANEEHTSALITNVPLVQRMYTRLYLPCVSLLIDIDSERGGFGVQKVVHG